MGDRVRAFVAVDVDDRVRQQVARVQSALRGAAPGARWVDPALCHIALKFLGSVPAERLPDVQQACRRAAASARPYELGFRGVGTFPRWRGARVLWMGIDAGLPALSALQATVEALLAPLGFALEGRPFSPHLTLARFKQPPGPGLEEAARRFQDERFGQIHVGELRLMRSDLRPSGPIYTVLSPLPLGEG